MKFVIFHGAYGSPEGNWFPELKESLENLGQTVIVPEFPVEDWNKVIEAGKGFKTKKQSLKAWLKIFEKTMKVFKKGEKLCFVGHSLSPVFILHIVEKYKIKLDCAIFVSPFMRDIGDWRFDIVNKTFYKTNFDWEEIRKYIPVSYVLYSDNDPYVDKKYPLEFAEKMGSSLVFVKRAGHMNREVNLNEFPLVLELCKTRIDLSLYQKFLAHRRELFAVPYVKGKTEEVVYLKPHEVFAEGIFHFRNLKNEGFATFYTALRFWDTQSVYMEESRKAAQRMGNFTRVFIIDKTSDLKRKNLLEQIKLDIEAGVKVYLCTLKDVKNKITELDFGIWDNDYLCTVHFNKKKAVNEVKVSSRRVDLKAGNRWKDTILKQSIRIYKIRDVEKFAG